MTTASKDKVNREYWKSNFAQRRAFIKAHVKVDESKRSRVPDSRRNVSRVYCLPNQGSANKSCCKKAFLNVLGYTADKVLTDALNTEKTFVSAISDERGRHQPKHAFSEVQVQRLRDHILSFNPSISHYRREHTPRSFYLPPNLTIKEMVNDFKSRHGPISRSRYGDELRKMNISFAKL